MPIGGGQLQKFWQRFCEAAEHPEWNPRAREPLPQSALIRDLAAFFASETLAQCEARFAGAGCCVTPVLTLGEALASPHCRHRDLVRRGATGDLQALFPARVDGAPPATRAPVQTVD